jgi:predicted DNA-binding transcriptional regulator AlpA
MSETTPRRLLNLTNTAIATDSHPASVRRWSKNAATGFPEPVNIHNKLFWYADEVEKWIASRPRVEPAPNRASRQEEAHRGQSHRGASMNHARHKKVWLRSRCRAGGGARWDWQAGTLFQYRRPDPRASTSSGGFSSRTRAFRKTC